MKAISIEKTADYAAVAAIHDALDSYNLAKTGHARVEVRAERFAEQFALVAVDGEGRAHGGLAYHWENAPRHVFVDYFYLDDTLRGTGVGRRVFEEMLRLAEAGGAAEVRLTTNTFQAPGFYLKMGFEITGEKAEPAPLCPENVHYTLCRKLIPPAG